MNTDLRGDGTAPGLDLRSMHSELRSLERRDWSLWITAITIMLTLVVGVYSLTLGIHEGLGSWTEFNFKAASLGLFGIVVLFAIFAIYKQVLINRMRRQLAGQMNMLASLHTRAELFHKLAVLDPLTGLYNRRFVMQHLSVELARCSRDQYKLTVVMFDLNGLKRINDNYSHLAGDIALRRFAGALRRAIRSSDMAARLGGDEFVAVLPECDRDTVPHILARLRGLRADFGSESIPVDFSAGWAEHTPGETADELLARADAQLYEDKRTGSARSRAHAARQERDESRKMEAVGRLTNSIVYDFNSLLAIIKGYAQLLLTRTDLDSAARQQIGSIDEAAGKATHLTRQLVDFSRSHVQQPRLLGLNEILSGMEPMLGRMLGGHIAVSLAPQNNLHRVYADPGQIEQVVLSLAANARDNMPDGGHLILETSNFPIDLEFVAAHPGTRPGSYVRLTMRGSGNTPDGGVHSPLGGPTDAADPGTNPHLGLSAVYGAVRENGGCIWVDSEPGVGTSVNVCLPEADGPECAQNAASTISEAADSNSAHTILVVEPMASLRSYMSECLRTSDYKVLEASAGEEAVEIAGREGGIDLIVCGAMLPGMSGLDVAECIARTQPQVQMLFIYGGANDAMFYPEWLRNSRQFLATPFEAREFSERVSALLGREETAVPVV